MKTIMKIALGVYLGMAIVIMTIYLNITNKQYLIGFAALTTAIAAVAALVFSSWKLLAWKKRKNIKIKDIAAIGKTKLKAFWQFLRWLSKSFYERFLSPVWCLLVISTYFSLPILVVSTAKYNMGIYTMDVYDLHYVMLGYCVIFIILGIYDVWEARKDYDEKINSLKDKLKAYDEAFEILGSKDKEIKKQINAIFNIKTEEEKTEWDERKQFLASMMYKNLPKSTVDKLMGGK